MTQQDADSPLLERPVEPATGRILVVDDIPANVRLLTVYLETEGYDVLTAAGGEEALEVMRDNTPDIVLLDVMMPTTNGFEVCRRIKSEDGTRHIPVILVTALSAIDDKLNGMEAGADDFLSKPVDRMELLLRVKSLLRIKSLHDRLNEKIFELKSAEARLRQQANTDPLTGLRNKRYFDEFVAREISRAERYRRPLSLVIADIDRFKSINDEYGHQVGDALIQQIATMFATSLRNIDLAARYGGEEFVFVLLETGKNDATSLTETLRDNIERYEFLTAGGESIRRITCSMGVATFPQDGASSVELLGAADRRLYLAKAGGRNRVVDEDGPREGSSPARGG